MSLNLLNEKPLVPLANWRSSYHSREPSKEERRFRKSSDTRYEDDDVFSHIFSMAIEEPKRMTALQSQMLNITSELIKMLNESETPKLRIKRQSGGGKYADAAKMDQTKILRLWLQMFANSWSKVYVGGAHPLHPEVPKPVIIMFKRRIGEFLFPKLEDEEEKS